MAVAVVRLCSKSTHQSWPLFLLAAPRKARKPATTAAKSSRSSRSLVCACKMNASAHMSHCTLLHTLRPPSMQTPKAQNSFQSCVPQVQAVF